MINLRLRTEYSFGIAYGPLPRVIEAVGDAPSLAITDRGGTWGHVAFSKACKKANKKPIFGVELAVVEKLEREKSPINYMAFLAKTNAGLKQIYELTSEATRDSNFYFEPRIDYGRVAELGQDVAVLSGPSPRFDLLAPCRNLFLELGPNSNSSAVKQYSERFKTPVVACSDNLYPRPEHREIYEIVAGRRRDSRTTPMHILDSFEWELACRQVDGIGRSHILADECNAEIPKAKMVKFDAGETLEAMCRRYAPVRGINLNDPIYGLRLRRELDLIAEKDFADYFFVIEDMLRYAKQHMLVGPARGSSCGSLVCYLLSITEIDPIPFGLLFERFIDINRKDLPDIDIDFPDNRRDMVFTYIENKYGRDCVARLGTVMRYQAKSAIDAVAIALHIPKWETEDLKNSIMFRSSGDARAAFCILDTFNDLEIGRAMLSKYPHLKIASDIEDHASTTGQHAAGVVITEEPISYFCSVNNRSGSGVAMVDKKDAESVNLLKIDALGLRTLAVIQDCLDQVGLSREWILKYPIDDKAAFDVLNKSRFAGIFQFEGYALQNLCQQMKVTDFEDVAALTALARPGPLNSGGATEYVKRKMGVNLVVPIHSSIADITKITYGVVIYQEQVMQIARQMGQMNWEDVSTLRSIMSKTLGDEAFAKHKVTFMAGAQSQGITPEDALHTWKNICTMGSWSFNRSHAVAYGMVSYWCLVLKAKYPLEWAAACLRHSSDDEQCVKFLRELDKEGYRYKDFDYDRSELNWSIKNGELLGGLLNIVGIGKTKAADIISKRKSGKELTKAMESKLRAGVTPYSYEKVFQCRSRFAEVIKNPLNYGIVTKLWRLGDITSDMTGEFLFFGKITKKDLRDLNEPFFVQKRNGDLIPEGSPRLFLNLTVEDDTANILVCIGKNDYGSIGERLYQDARINDWYLWKGRMRSGFRKIYIERYLSEAQILRRKK